MKSRMICLLSLSLAAFFFMAPGPGSAPAADEKAAPPDVPRAGKNFLVTPVYSEAEDQRVLALYAGLRVSDVVDGMDAVGLQNIGLMDQEIHALWRDPELFKHRFAGVAITARYVPTQNSRAGKMTPAAYDDWAGDWYEKRSGEPFMPLIRKGTALVIEDAPDADVGRSALTTSWNGRALVAPALSAARPPATRTKSRPSGSPLL